MAIRKRTWKSGDGTKTAWVLDYKDGAGDRRLKTFKTKKDADADATTALYHVTQGTHTPDSASRTVAEAAHLWLKRGESEGLERSTLDQYRLHADRYIKPGLGGTKLSALTTPMMEAFKDALLAEHSRAMSRKVLSSLKGILSDAQRRGLVAQNVARMVTVKADRRHTRRLKVGTDVPTKDEVSAILAAATGRWRPFFITAVFTGLRASELRGLRRQDVDLDKRVLHVRQRADRFNAIGSPKSAAGHRDVPLAPMVVNALKEWKLACPPSELDLVFPNGRGKPESLANIWNRGLIPVQKAAGVVDGQGRAKYNMHALRHFCASWLIEQGFQPKRVQAILGHASIVMTFDRYGHLFPSDDDDQARLAAGELAVVG